MGKITHKDAADMSTAHEVSEAEWKADTGHLDSQGNTLEVSRAATLIVAANNSSSKSKAGADYVCDGTADDVQIQAAIDALPAGGGRVLLSEGTFAIAVAAKIDLASNLVLEGQGFTTILQKATSPSELNVLKAIGTEGGELSNIAVKNLKLDGNNSSEDNLYLISALYVDGFYIESIYALGGTNKKGRIQFTHCNQIKITNSIFDQIRHVQISGSVTPYDDTTIDTDDVLVEGCTFYNTNATGFAVGNIARRWRIVGNSFDGGYSAIDTAYSPESTIIGNTIKNFTVAGIYTESARVVTIAGNTLWNCKNSIHARNSGGKIVAGRISITGNSIYDEDNDAITLEGTPRVVVSGNLIEGADRHGIMLTRRTVGETDYYADRCIIVGNYIYDFGRVSTYSRGICLYAADYTIVHDNYIDGDSNANANACITETTDSDYNDIQGNILINATAAIHPDYHGANTVIRDNQGYITENSGTATLVNGNTSIAVNHGLAVTPVAGDIMVTPIEGWGAMTEFYIDTYTSTQFTIHADQDPGQDVDFAWKAVVL